MPHAILPSPASDTGAHVLTLSEAARELRCSKSHLYRILSGKITAPPLPVFHIGRKALIRTPALHQWIGSLEAREREASYVSGNCGLRDDELEFIAGA
jgi:excisionase family DNA binding protein